MGTEFEEEPPLDPVLENVRRKLVRRMAWSLGIMMVGLMAILGAIVYKITVPEKGDADLALGEPRTIAVDIADGESITKSQLDGRLVLVETMDDAGNRSLLIVDLESGQVHTRINFE